MLAPHLPRMAHDQQCFLREPAILVQGAGVLVKALQVIESAPQLYRAGVKRTTKGLLAQRGTLHSMDTWEVQAKGT